MPDQESVTGKYKSAILTATVLFSVLMAFYANIRYRTDIVYTHFFYLPIIISGVWYHRKAVWVALFFGLVHISANVVSSGHFEFSTVLRSLMFVVVALVIGIVSEKKDRFYDELQKTTQQNNHMFESVREGIIGVNLQGNITFANQAALRMMGCTETDAVCGGHNIIFHLLKTASKEDRGQDLPIFRTMRDGNVRRKTGQEFYSCRDAAGSSDVVYVDYVCTPILENNSIIGAVVVATDVTEQIRLDNEIARFDRLDSLGRMAGSLAHEIRNPLTTVRGFLQIYMNRQQVAAARDDFQLMIDELDRANSIITEYLSLGRNRVTGEKLQDINSIINAISPLIMADAVNAGKELAVSLEEVPELVVDDKEIRQLVLNLVSNGLEATPAGGTVTIKTFTDCGEAVLAVYDQGEGIKPEVLEKIGTPFFTTKKNGTGLGLAVCHGIVARHNARMQIDTGSQGSAFIIRFSPGRRT